VWNGLLFFASTGRSLNIFVYTMGSLGNLFCELAHRLAKAGVLGHDALS
jgi:hypothetical protein